MTADNVIGLLICLGGAIWIASRIRDAELEEATSERGNGDLTGTGGSSDTGPATSEEDHAALPSPAPVTAAPPTAAAAQCACQQIVYPWYTSPYCLGCGRLTPRCRWLCPICRQVVGGDAKVQAILHVADSASTPADLKRASDLADAVLQDLRMFQAQAKYN